MKTSVLLVVLGAAVVMAQDYEQPPEIESGIGEFVSHVPFSIAGLPASPLYHISLVHIYRVYRFYLSIYIPN